MRRLEWVNEEISVWVSISEWVRPSIENVKYLELVNNTRKVLRYISKYNNRSSGSSWYPYHRMEWVIAYQKSVPHVNFAFTKNNLLSERCFIWRTQCKSSTPHIVRNSQHSSSSVEHGSCLSMLRHPWSRHFCAPLLFVHCVYQIFWNRVAYYRNLQDPISLERLATDRHTASKEHIRTGYLDFSSGVLLLLWSV